jgi:methylmalonyl-CoA/ethylmalonyl-CoA epimerase
MIIDHIGIVVRSLKEGIENWERLFGYRKITEPVTNTRQKVKVVFLEKKSSILVKLIEPTDSASPIYRCAQKGGGLHHLCFKCDNLYEDLETLKNKGAKILVPPQPGEAFENENIAFIYTNQGQTVEMIDTEKKAHKLS